MEDYFLPMNEHYKEKHFPKGFLEAIRNANGVSGIVLIVVSTVMFIIFTPVLIFGAGILFSSLKEGDSDGVTAGMVIGGFGLFMTCICIFFFFLGISSRKDKIEDCLAELVKYCKYPENTILEFATQATQSDTLILHLAGASKVKTGAAIDLLTRDFIRITTMVMKKSDITTACIVNSKTSYYNGKRNVTSYGLEIAFISNKGTHIMTPAKKEIAQKLIAMLLEENPNIDTKQGQILTDEEFEACYKAQELNAQCMKERI